MGKIIVFTNLTLDAVMQAPRPAQARHTRRLRAWRLGSRAPYAAMQ